MTVRTSQAQWKGSLKQGQGTMKLGSGAFEDAYSFPSRFENDKGTNPEELIGAAHAGCFSMTFSLFCPYDLDVSLVHPPTVVHWAFLMFPKGNLQWRRKFLNPSGRCSNDRPVHWDRGSSTVP
jgi:hypothetical protein